MSILSKSQYSNIVKRLSHIRRALETAEELFGDLSKCENASAAGEPRPTVHSKGIEAMTSAEVSLCQLVSEVSQAETTANLLGGNE